MHFASSLPFSVILFRYVQNPLHVRFIWIALHEQMNNDTTTMDQLDTKLSESGTNRVYLDFYDLKESPFSITPDPEFLFFSSTHKSAIDKILYGINNRMGFILLIGEVGTGKTTICRSVLDSLDGNVEMVYIINPSISGRDLISSILDDLGLSYPPDSSKKDLIHHLNHFLLSAEGNRPVGIIIDDAQTMPTDALEDLRLLSNLETDKEKLLQMVLVGQPELLTLIQRTEMRQLRQRVAMTCNLEFLAKEEIDGYIRRRLFIAGDSGHIRFTPKAISLIVAASDGIPRLINKVCDYALTAGYITDDYVIGPKHVKRALKELGDLDFKKDFSFFTTPGWLKFGGSKSVLFTVSGLIILMLILFFGRLVELNLFRHMIDNKILPRAGALSTIAEAEIPAQNPMASIAKRHPEDHLAPGPNTSEKPVSADKFPLNNGVPSSDPVSIKMDIVVDKKTAGEGISSPGPITKDSPIKITSETYPYILQLASYKTFSNTLRAVSLYENYETDIHWNRVDLGEKGVWFRLYTGRFKTKEEAKQYEEDLGLDESMVLSTPWTVLVDPGNHLHSPEKIKSVLEENKYDFYSIKNEDESFRLLIGAFRTKKGAEKLAQEIVELNLDAKAVLR